MANKTEHLGVIPILCRCLSEQSNISAECSAETVSEASSRYGEVDNQKMVNTTSTQTLASAGVLCYNISNMEVTRPCWRSIASP